MKSKRNIVVCSLVALCAAATVAFASGYKHPYFDKVLCFFKDDSKLVIKGVVANLDKHKKTEIKASAAADVTIQCVNPAGNEPPGQRKTVRVEASASKWYDKGYKRIKFILKLLFAVDASACPNPKWSVRILDVDLVDCQLTAYQGGKKVATFDCSELCADDDDDGKCDDDHGDDCPSDGHCDGDY